MSIFIEEKDCIEVAIHYVLEPDGGITIFENPIVKAPSVKEDLTAETQTINMVFNRPDFATSQRLMSASTVTDSNGNQTMNIMMLQNNLIYFLARSWDIKNEAGEPVELTNYNIGKLQWK